MGTMKPFTKVAIASSLALPLILLGILRTEQMKRELKSTQASSDTNNLSAMKGYFDSLERQKESLRNQMVGSKAEYDKLLAEQSSIIDSKKRAVTTTVMQNVPVTTTTQVPSGSTAKATASGSTAKATSSGSTASVSAPSSVATATPAAKPVAATTTKTS